MAIHTNRWKPDTCGCEIIYQWDDSVEQENRVHTSVEKAKDNKGKDIFTKNCPVHTIPDHAQLYTAVHEENTRKNVALHDVLESIPSLKRTLSQTEKDTIKLIAQVKGETIDVPDEVLRDGVEVSWSFDDQRNVVLTTNGFTTAEKNSANSIVQAKFGNKVKIV